MKATNILAIAVLAVLAFAWNGLAVLDAKSPVDPQQEEETVVAEEKPEKKGESPEELAAKRRSTERKIQIARMKLEHAVIEQQSQERVASESARHAVEELELARAKLAQYRDVDSKNKHEQAKISLQGAKDRAQEAAEELAQIEIMYEGQDLDDRTAEFVISRGRRMAQRAARQIAIQERSLDSMANHEIPRELRRMQLDVDRKQAALEKATRDGKSGALQKRIAVLSSESEIAGLEEEIAKLDRKASDK